LWSFYTYSPTPQKENSSNYDNYSDDDNNNDNYDPHNAPNSPERSKSSHRSDKGKGHDRAVEKQSRTLFVRNINYTVTEREIREAFESFGEIKDVFNRIETRGIIFITFVCFYSFYLLFVFIL
jgi:RNA recognition motif-containing protein